MFIYQITNDLTGDFYIGKTIKSPTFRWKRHIYASKRPKTHLQKAIAKYGKDTFSLNVLESCDDAKTLNDREIWWINHKSPPYNETKGGDGGDTSKSEGFIRALKSRPSTKGKTYEEIYGDAEAKRLRETIKLRESTASSKVWHRKQGATLRARYQSGSIRLPQGLKQRTTCNICGLVSNVGNIRRWHNLNCKSSTPQSPRIEEGHCETSASPSYRDPRHMSY